MCLPYLMFPTSQNYLTYPMFLMCLNCPSFPMFLIHPVPLVHLEHQKYL